MSSIKMNRKVLGINGLGRIGKLSLWYHLLQGHFDEYVVNTGRDVGKRLESDLKNFDHHRRNRD